MTETQTSGRKPKKKKNKESHNAVERHRKEKINAGISRIGNLLPCSQALKQSKIMILDQAFRYITELKKQNDTMLLEGAEKTQASEIRRLRLQLEDMRKESAHYIQLLKAHDILEDPTVHWKEQAEMLALAMLEQDSPDRKTAVCTGNKTGTSNPNTGTWEPTKPSSVSTAKDCGHQQHLQQQLHQQHFRHQDKSCDAPVSRAHHSGHLPQQDHHKPAQDHNAMQRMMSSRSLEQTLISPPTNPVSRSSELVCAPSRQERQRVSNYSAEALIGKSSTNDQRMSLHLQPGRGAAQEQPDLRGYLDSSRTKANITHNPLNRIPTEHSRPVEGQRVSMGAPHQVSSFEVQVSRGNEISVKSGPPAQRGPQGPQLGGFRTGAGPPADGRNRAVYNALPASQVQVGLVQDGCHQSFMQSLLSPHLPEQSVHNQVAQCCPPVSMEYCVPRSTSTELQAKTSSSSVSQNQKAPGMRLGESNKGHISLGSNLHSGVRTALSHAPNSSAEAGRSSAPSRTPAAVAQHTRHITRDTQPSKLRAGDRTRSGTVRSTNPFESEGPLSLPSGGGVLLGRPQTGAEARRSTIVRFMPDTAQGPADNNLVPDQHLTQNFGFPFIPEGGMNPPPAINANSTIIPPMSQQNAPRTPSLLPVEAQNTLPSFYPSYSPAAHPSLPSDVTLQYFPNQMFTSPSADKSSAPPLNNRFGSILSPPRPVGFGQTNFPLLTDMTPMPIANSSGITPHISNFSLTSLFPEIATGMPSDGSAMPMSPLLSLSNTSSDAGKQPNRPAHNISHILGHDGSSAV
uniref:BHLH domain-containing protein n=1 Tax=Knipowitschia caucasica TaxID=637954 RepID=A0AAV2L7F9_KNICA